MALSPSEIAAAAKAGGFTGTQIPIATAIALGESGGNPHAHNSTPPDDSYGLWQINMYGSMGPSRRTQFGISSNEQLYDPVTNAHAAFLIYQGQGWKAWSVYSSGKYLSHLGVAQSADSSVSVPGGTSPTVSSPGGGGTEGIRDLTGVLGTPGTWWRTGFVVGGSVMLLVGFGILLKRTGYIDGAHRVVQHIGKGWKTA